MSHSGLNEAPGSSTKSHARPLLELLADLGPHVDQHDWRQSRGLPLEAVLAAREQHG
jgi:hypothetical protein